MTKDALIYAVCTITGFAFFVTPFITQGVSVC